MFFCGRPHDSTQGVQKHYKGGRRSAHGKNYFRKTEKNFSEKPKNHLTNRARTDIIAGQNKEGCLRRLTSSPELRGQQRDSGEGSGSVWAGAVGIRFCCIYWRCFPSLN
jgi:SET domain-containing protein